MRVRSVGRLGWTCTCDFCEIAICEDGEVRSAGRVESTPEALGVGGELGGEDRVALEVTGAAWEIAQDPRAACREGGRGEPG